MKTALVYPLLFIRLACLVFLVGLSHSATAQVNWPDTLYTASDVVLSGRVVSIGAPTKKDEILSVFPVILQIDSVYKQNFFINSNQLTINWLVDNKQYNSTKKEAYIERFADSKQVFFLQRQHFAEGGALSQKTIWPFTLQVQDSLTEIAQQKKINIQVLHFGRNKTCAPDCSFCDAIAHSDWKKVEKHIDRKASRKGKDTIPYMQHRKVKWAHSDREILSSLPSYSGTRFMFLTDSGEVSAYAGYQIGYVRSYLRWVPYLLYKGFGWQANKYFYRSNTNAVILRSFVLDSLSAKQYFGYDSINFTFMLTDTGRIKQYGPIMPLPMELVKLSSIFDGGMHLYTDYHTRDDYYPFCQGYASQLVAEKKIYHLCLMANHTVPDIGMFALDGLAKLKDERCIPFLIQLADYESRSMLSGVQNASAHEAHMRKLIEMLDGFTGVQTMPQSVPMGVSPAAFEASLSVPLWRQRIYE